MVKFTQVAGSAVGAVLSAVIASFFGVKGTIIGVAIGSAVATTVSALAVKSLERGHQAVRHVVIEQNPLVRRAGGTAAAGQVTSAEVEDAGPSLAEAAAPPNSTVAPDPPVARHAAGNRGVTASRDAVGTRRPLARSGGSPAGRPPAPSLLGAASGRPAAGGPPSSFRWIVTGVVAFVVALLVVTLIELGAGRPLAALLGSSTAQNGTTAGNFVTGTGPPPTTTPPTTTPPTTTPTTTTTTPRATSTTTTAPGATTITTPTTTTPTTTTPTTTTTTTAPATGSSGGTSAGPSTGAAPAAAGGSAATGG